MTSVSDLMGYLRAPSDHAPIRIHVGSDTIVCPLDLLCALIVNKGSTEKDIAALLRDPVSPSDLQKAMDIVAMVRSDQQVDIERLMRDGKYAIQVQEMPNLSDLVHSSAFIDQILPLSLNTLGCRVVQKLVESVPPEFVGNIIHQLEKNIVECSLDVNGNHVIQKLIDLFPQNSSFIIEGILSENNLIAKLSLHCYGCRVIQRLMAKCDIDLVAPILESLCSDPATIGTLANDVFGNYVMQHALEFGRPMDKDRISLCLASMDIVQLGCSKFASNVVEKAIRRAGTESANSVMVTRLMLNAMLLSTDPVTREPGIITLMKDRYGNYVVRAVIELGRPEFAAEVDTVKHIILDNANTLKKYTFSWHLVERLDKMTE